MKKFLIGGIAAGIALLAPGLAGAQVVPGATYEGTFTTGLGGTVSLEISADGSTVDIDVAGFGQTGCPDASAARAGVPVDQGLRSFSLFEDDPSVTLALDGYFGSPGAASGTAQLAISCDSGLQSWTAETPVVWPDGYLEHAFLGFAGENVYNATGADQAIRQTVRQGKVGRFLVHVQNDGTEPDGIDVKGCGPSKGFKPTFTQAGDNITSQVKAGTYQTAAVDTDESETLKLAIKVSRKAKPRRTKSCMVTMTHSGTFRGTGFARVDAVKAEVKVKRRG